MRALREKMGLTLEQFAERFGLQLTSVRDWEQHLRRPDPAAHTLLRVIAKHPDAVADAVATA
ncbi:helix-turn-helix domain-containing protein [Roseomonas sp. GC11]|uniref:helix-turn-helix domain-containing protein n=1 Tax=Roseomonas sp. GC11 TaxID=2950546 RepID=UPI00351F19D0